MGGDWKDSVGNLEPQPSIFPDGVAPVVRKTATGRELLNMRWGFPPPPQAKSPYTTNIRETKKGFWKPWLYKSPAPDGTLNVVATGNRQNGA